MPNRSPHTTIPFFTDSLTKSAADITPLNQLLSLFQLVTEHLQSRTIDSKCTLNCVYFTCSFLGVQFASLVSF
ncbi:hypothetical protein L6452_19333 [Arctium lappa]|uniref:Uncharacterized protein n=1 Tax=Arctium lappa TaxID=4217 RepID=A0ACB9B8A8_ARCLA|nr:hypothetical protein L6452_19333 [Arctium lappa]